MTSFVILITLSLGMIGVRLYKTKIRRAFGSGELKMLTGVLNLNTNLKDPSHAAKYTVSVRVYFGTIKKLLSTVYTSSSRNCIFQNPQFSEIPQELYHHVIILYYKSLKDDI